jgi:hypothetical protein
MRRGPPRQWEEEAVGRFPAGTFARIKGLLHEGESRTEFLREAVAREIARREELQRRAAAIANVAGWIA